MSVYQEAETRALAVPTAQLWLPQTRRHPQGQTGGGASSCHHPTMRSAPKNPRASLRGSDPHGQDQKSKALHLFINTNALHTLARVVRDGQDLLVASRQTDTYHAAERSCPLLCQQILPSSRLSTIGTLRGRKGEPALQGE